MTVVRKVIVTWPCLTGWAFLLTWRLGWLQLEWMSLVLQQRVMALSLTRMMKTSLWLVNGSSCHISLTRVQRPVAIWGLMSILCSLPGMKLLGANVYSCVASQV